MAVDQAYVTSLTAKVKSELFNVADNYAVMDNNGIGNPKVAKDIQRLNVILKTLDNYDVTADYFDEEYILKIEREFRNHCGYKGNQSSSSAATKTGGTTVNLNLAAETYHEFTSSQAISANEQSTGVIVPEDPDVQIDVYIDGWPMMIGDGSKARDVYFSSDGGATAKTIASIAQNDVLYYNAIIAGANLGTTEVIKLEIL